MSITNSGLFWALFASAILCIAAFFAFYSKGRRDERSEAIAVSILIAKADSNIVGLQNIAKTDSSKANDAGLNIIYWRGVKDAFLSLDEDEVRVLRSSLRPQ